MVILGSMPLIVLLSLAANNRAEIVAIESKVLANRRAVSRAHVVIESHSTKWQDGKMEPRDAVRTIYLDGQKSRYDLRRRYDQMPSFVQAPKNPSAEYHTAKRFFSEEKYAWYSDRLLPGGKTFVVTVMPRELAWKQRGNRTPDLRMWGLTPETFGMSTAVSQMESFIAAPHRKNLRLSHAVERQVQCDKITFTNPSDVFVQVWVAPSMGYSVVRMQTQFDKPERKKSTHYVYNIELDVKRQEPSGIWFPVASHFRRTENGKLTWEEHAKATVYSLNEPLDPRLFTLAGLDIPASRRVSQYGADPTQYWVWDGEKVVAMRATGMIAEGQSVSGRVFFILLSTGFAILASMLIWHWSRRRAN